MSDIITEKQVADLKIKAKGGTPSQIADYSLANKRFNELKERLFDGEEYPYASNPDETYVKKLKENAEKEGADDIDKFRYEIIKANREDLDARLQGEDVKGFKQQKNHVEGLIRDKEAKIKKGDLELARQVAIQNSSAENLAFYSTLKKRYAEQKGK